MKEIAGGLWMGALCTGALFGLIPGLVLFGIGSLCAACELHHEWKSQKQAENWQKNYPSYKY